MEDSIGNYVIYVDGMNLYDIRYLNYIDVNKIISNDVNAIYETYGIEATRKVLIAEFMEIFETAVL